VVTLGGVGMKVPRNAKCTECLGGNIVFAVARYEGKSRVYLCWHCFRKIMKIWGVGDGRS
jgi:hypothetical protein